MRVVYDGVDDLRRLMPDLTETRSRAPTSARTPRTSTSTTWAASRSTGAIRISPRSWSSAAARRCCGCASKGVRFAPIWGRQAFKIDGHFKFWGGLTVEAWGGGEGLVEALTKAVRRAGIDLWYESPRSPGRATTTAFTACVRQEGTTVDVRAKAVVLARGGFQANPEWRTRYLGPGWELAKVRGTRFNTGDGIRMALDVGAAPLGNWSGCHAVALGAQRPRVRRPRGRRRLPEAPLSRGLMINAEGKRFVDEGADFRNYTYAKYGRVILNQPGQFAWQIFDAKVRTCCATSTGSSRSPR